MTRKVTDNQYGRLSVILATAGLLVLCFYSVVCVSVEVH